MENVLNIIKDKTLTFEQKVLQLAREAENSINVLNISSEAKEFMDKGIICDLFEGNAPYRPRYILPDYKKFMENGSRFLGLKPAENLLEAVNNLLILYKHVPSITSFPVYLGEIDKLLEPYAAYEDEEYVLSIIKLFLTHIDRTLTDSFVHANIGPEATKVGRAILIAERELRNAVPNLTLKYSKDTPRDFAIEAVRTGLEVSKPYFANHKMFQRDFGDRYGIASCYNGLPIGGGSYTLVRLNLKRLAEISSGIDDFLNRVIPYTVKLMVEVMDERIRFLVEESNFFESSFLVDEGLILKDRFTAMFGIFGLAECVNILLNAVDKMEKYGHSEKANNLGVEIIEKLNKEVNNYHNPYCKITKGKFLLHAQSGISSDIDASPGCRIPIGDEPEIYEHILQASMFHKYFPSGISDIFTFDSTAKNNPEYVLNIIDGAMESGLRMFSFYCSDSDLIRITGYLVKKSDMDRLKNGYQALHDTVSLGLEAVEKQGLLDRKVRRYD